MLTDLLAARSQMAMSLAFHIIFAAVGMAMPWLMVVAEGLYLRTGDPVYKELAKRWAKGTAILFAVGAVSGTVLSFELGLLWPTFMEFAGPYMGMPFSLEGFAFFLEAIFLGIYLYGWDRISRLAHLAAGVMVGICGIASAMFVICANSWMNTPTGIIRDASGAIVDIDVWAAMFSPGAIGQGLHMVTAAFVAVGFAVAAIHAHSLLRDPDNRFHRNALAIGVVVGGGFALLQPVSGHAIGQIVARHQPAKFAALEAHWDTHRGVPLLIGGWPDEQAEVTRYAIAAPRLASFLAFDDFNAEIQGLKDFPRDERPPVAVTHLAFQIMLGTGGALIAATALGGLLALKNRGLPDQRAYLWLLVACGPLGFLGIEAGWTATEVGRQPWIIYGVMRTADAVTPAPGLVVPFTMFSLIYLMLCIASVLLLRRQVAQSPSYPRETPIGA